MIWRDGKEYPKFIGRYYVFCRDGFLLDQLFQLSWWNGDKWDHDVIAWLDPEIPEKYLPKKLWKGPKTPLVEFETELLEEALGMRELIEGKRVEEPKGEWLPFATFKFDMSKYYWAKDGNQTWVVDGYGCISPNIDLGSKAQIWSIPIEEPPR